MLQGFLVELLHLTFGYVVSCVGGQHQMHGTRLLLLVEALPIGVRSAVDCHLQVLVLSWRRGRKPRVKF